MSERNKNKDPLVRIVMAMPSISPHVPSVQAANGRALFITWLELLLLLAGFCTTCSAFKGYYNSVLDIQRLTMEIVSYWTFFNEAASKQ